ncbi:hypothetical protein BT93_E1454 [Corymbia citriodora subsp. variegata]|nr:hypothetical protein BT93_E1454 [Corymbia citriodora subsp. variegata]
MEGPSSAPLLHGSPGSSSSSFSVQNANAVTPWERDLLGRLSSVVLNNNERNNEEENRHAGIDTDLSLSTDRLRIKKKLTVSDLQKDLSRLLLPRRCVETHVLPQMDEEMVGQVRSRNGLQVVVRDIDAHQDHRLVFHYWASSKSYVLHGGWIRPFVEGRGLKLGDEIGMFWDPDACKFYFTVHCRAPSTPRNTAG